MHKPCKSNICFKLLHLVVWKLLPANFTRCSVTYIGLTQVTYLHDTEDKSMDNYYIRNLTTFKLHNPAFSFLNKNYASNLFTYFHYFWKNQIVFVNSYVQNRKQRVHILQTYYIFSIVMHNTYIMNNVLDSLLTYKS